MPLPQTRRWKENTGMNNKHNSPIHIKTLVILLKTFALILHYDLGECSQLHLNINVFSLMNILGLS